MIILYYNNNANKGTYVCWLGGSDLEHVDYLYSVIIPTLELLFDLHERKEISKENILLIASSICNVDQEVYGDILNDFAKILKKYERLK